MLLTVDDFLYLWVKRPGEFLANHPSAAADPAKKIYDEENGFQ